MERDGEVTGLRVPRMDGRFLPVLRRLATAESGVRLVADKDLRAPAFKMQFGACVLEAGAYGDGSPLLTTTSSMCGRRSGRRRPGSRAVASRRCAGSQP